MKVASCILTALAALWPVAAHSTFQDFWVGSTDEVETCARQPLNNNPVTSVTSSDIACNTNAGTSPGYCTAAAGGQVSVEMHAQPKDRSCSNLAIGGNHDGPVIIYMAKVDNALTAVGSSARWFKVSESGLLSKDYWATDALNDNCGKYTFTIPSCLPAGDYLVRAEVIALHVAGQLNGAQFYMTCYTIKVTGGGSASPATVSFPGAYSANDPGIHFDLYGSYTSYTIPGPAVFSCSDPPAPQQPTTAIPTLTIVVPTTSAPPPVTTPGAALYGQCGGQGWTGPTTCAQGTCKAQGSYYSQCVP